MTPAFIGRDGRSLSSRISLLAALAAASTGEPTSLIRIAAAGEASPYDGSTIHAALRVVEAALGPGELSVTLDALLTGELLVGRSVVLDLPSDGLADPALAARADIIRVVPVGPLAIDLRIAGAKLADTPSAPASGLADPTSRVRLLSCGLAPGTPQDEQGRLGNAGRSHERVGGRWLRLGIPDLPPAAWDALIRGEPHVGVLALGQALVRELRGEPGHEPAGEPPAEILAARIWGLAMDIQAYERGFLPTAAELARAPLIDDWDNVRRSHLALTGRFEGHPYIRDGGRSITSDVFHTDGRTYARTLSRLYRLGRPARRHLH